MTTTPTLDFGTDPALDEARRTGLRRMRTIAVSLLLLAATVYLLTLDQDGFLGFVNAGAEASMVGAIADWFAVTALFKHPLGIPVPHTALIPTRKDELGRSLQDFVGANFLQESVIRDRIAHAGVSERVGHWIADPDNSKRVVDEVASVLHLGLSKVRDEDLAALVEDALLPRFKEEPISPVAGSLLEEIVRDGAHHGLVDLVLEEMHRWLLANEETFTEVVGERAPWWSPQAVNERVTHRLYVEVLAWVDDIRRDPYHHARTALDSVLAQLAQDLLHDEATQERAERLKERVLDHPQVVVTATSLWNAFRTALLTALADEDGPLRHRGALELTRFGTRLVTEEKLRKRLDGFASDFAVFVVGRYGDELTAVITHTVDRWDGKEAARRIELYVGRDLQFIRINGTIVGGLVGVTIHAVTVLVQ
ncbi:MAG TPA: DUF445 domain-containing protein [Nocardioidaceae bacterium]|nr:DUF445 domain-containing protein [Nocardioidaceae bacterium]